LTVELSVLFPTYNAENKNIKDCLKSLKKQTYKNFYLLVIDNQSTDNTLKIIKSSGIKYKIISKKDKSFNDGVNNGFKKIKSKYFTIISSDDVITNKNYFNNLVNYIKKNKNIDIVFPDYCEIINNKFYKKKQPDDFAKIAYDIIVPGLGWVAKKKIIKHSNFPTNLKASSDYYFLLKLFKKGFKFARLRGLYYCLRIGGNSFLNAFVSFKERRDISIKFGGNKYHIFFKYYILCLKFIIKFKIINLFFKDLDIKT
jgi:glycosyltransferase involved in cell wall biosynthesis